MPYPPDHLAARAVSSSPSRPEDGILTDWLAAGEVLECTGDKQTSGNAGTGYMQDALCDLYVQLIHPVSFSPTTPYENKTSLPRGSGVSHPYARHAHRTRPSS